MKTHHQWTPYHLTIGHYVGMSQTSFVYVTLNQELTLDDIAQDISKEIDQETALEYVITGKHYKDQFIGLFNIEDPELKLPTGEIEVSDDLVIEEAQIGTLHEYDVPFSRAKEIIEQAKDRLTPR